jgi:hypothetical protein
MNKPPAFQFYVKDWRSSPTVRRMSDLEKALFVDMLAAAWDSDEPGTLPLPIEVTARILGRKSSTTRAFLDKYPSCFKEISGKLVNEKLHDQWLRYQEISEKRASAAQSRYPANA